MCRSVCRSDVRRSVCGCPVVLRSGSGELLCSVELLRLQLLRPWLRRRLLRLVQEAVPSRWMRRLRPQRLLCSRSELLRPGWPDLCGPELCRSLRRLQLSD